MLLSIGALELYGAYMHPCLVDGTQQFNDSDDLPMGMSHNPSCLFRVPFKTILLSLIANKVFLSRKMLHPSSQS